MGKWYEEAVFYHMYPIGMSGAPRRNEQEKITHRFPMLELAAAYRAVGMHGDLYRPSF